MRHRRSAGLARARIGTTVRLTAVDADGVERLRLAEFGLRPGSDVTVVARTSGGGRMISVGTSRIAIDNSAARRMSFEVLG